MAAAWYVPTADGAVVRAGGSHLVLVETFADQFSKIARTAVKRRVDAGTAIAITGGGHGGFGGNHEQRGR